MHEATSISELRTALRRRGVWGSRAERLLSEWTEHVRDDAARRVEQGADPDAAQEAAWQALGNSGVLASSAARELNQASWLGRHPWLGGVALPFLGWIVVLAAVLFVPAPLIMRLVNNDTSAPYFETIVAGWQNLFNWLPWLLAVAWLGRIAARMPGGWKLFWVTAVALTILSPSLHVTVHMTVAPRLHSPGSGQIHFFWPSGLLGIVGGTLIRVFGDAPSFLRAYVHVPGPEQAQAMMQSALLLLGAMVFYLRATRAGKALSATMVSGWLGMCWVLQYCSAQGFIL